MSLFSLPVRCSALRGMAPAALLLLATAQCLPLQDIERANTLLIQGEYREARRMFSRAVERNPLSFDAQYGLGMTWCAEALHRTELNLAQPDDWFTAVYHMTRAQTLRDDPQARQTLAILHYNLGTSFHRSAQTGAAIARLEQAVSYDSTQIKALNLLGALYHEQGRLDDAARCYRSVVALVPGYAMGHFNLGAVAWARTAFDSAADHFARALEHAPGNEHFSLWLSRARERMEG